MVLSQATCPYQKAPEERYPCKPKQADYPKPTFAGRRHRCNTFPHLMISKNQKQSSIQTNITKCKHTDTKGNIVFTFGK